MGEVAVGPGRACSRWREWGLQPWRAESFKFSTDPRLEAKVRDVTGLSLNPPDEAVVLCVGEKPQALALEDHHPRQLGAPALTGMPHADWTQLTGALVIPYQAHREAGLHIARGGPASRKPAGGYPAALTLPEMILATILRARFRLPQRLAAELSGVVTGTIAKAERQIRPLPDQRRHVIQPAGTHVKTLAELTALAAARGVTLIPGTKAAR